MFNYMDYPNTILNQIIMKNDKLLVSNRQLQFNLYIKNILLSASILTNVFFLYKYRKN
jgi:hypothetical protein